MTHVRAALGVLGFLLWLVAQAVGAIGWERL